ncbi:hydroxyethylthiazole kinase [Shewanella sp. NFH-SH190041]|uniref:hydroxyethylthiazole kinase n=1 Tax=Shewanella sp. NFH-SH190041 TaxID=2950245 RepID=UPI0021C2F5DB|nr:hydroxyethylthiazole kinase [Shewanella sp. NFH-SH190041]BDM63411.1 hydroxyethylthiazole kinase [Shewanella sp. NFH-SH190041]
MDTVKTSQPDGDTQGHVSDIANDIGQQLLQLRALKPLVVNITNYVVMNNTANALLALGASPIMAHSRREMSQLLAICGALVINIGTLDQLWLERMIFAARQAVAKHRPLVLDPVGCGASDLRTQAAITLCDIAAPLGEDFIIRANNSEIIALASQLTQRPPLISSKGVDSCHRSDAALDAALTLRTHYGCTITISGETDYIIGPQCFSLSNGDAIMPSVTGMGCTLSALTGAFAAFSANHTNNSHRLCPALTAAAIMGVAGELAGTNCPGPGTFQQRLLDTLYQLSPADMLARLKLQQLSLDSLSITTAITGASQ